MKNNSSRHKLMLTTTVLSGLVICATSATTYRAENEGDDKSPIKHLVVIFQENVSFDHYFATYPRALNPPGEPEFRPVRNPLLPTPAVNGLTSGLLNQNSNSAKPFRFPRSRQLTCDQQHDYTPEQQAYNAGLLDKFVEFTGRTRPTIPPCEFGLGKAVVMGYYDGNTVTALWNYAQNFAMSDNSYQTTFGPSTPGAITLVSGQTHGVVVHRDVGDIKSLTVVNPDNSLTLIGNPRPYFDDCSPASKSLAELTGRNVGDLLNDSGVTWGWFQGGFAADARNADGTAVCTSQHTTVAGFTSLDYVPHHQPFQYYASTSNPHHLPPTSVRMIGHTDQANHQYDLSDFWKSARSGNLPAVSFLKAASYQDGHSESSDPLDEQTFLVNTINSLQGLPDWNDTAVIIAYDDSDGWYDHVMPPIVSQSNSTADMLTGVGSCGTAPAGAYQGECGYGPRLPLLVISRWARPNYVDHHVTDQTSVLRFIEDNWGLGHIGDHSFDERAGSIENMFNFGPGFHTRKLILDPSTGQRVNE